MQNFRSVFDGNGVQLWQIYKELYNQEVELRNYYDGKLGQTFTILSATAGLIIYSLERAINESFFSTIFLLLIVMSVIIFIVQLVCLFKAYFSIKYRYRDFPIDQIENDITQKINIVGKETDFDEKICEYIAGMLYRTYKVCAETYYKTNINKRKYHHILNLVSYVNFILLIVQYVIIFLEVR